MKKDKANQKSKRPKNLPSARNYQNLKIGKPYGKPSIPEAKIKEAVRKVMKEVEML